MPITVYAFPETLAEEIYQANRLWFPTGVVQKADLLKRTKIFAGFTSPHTPESILHAMHRAYQVAATPSTATIPTPELNPSKKIMLNYLNSHVCPRTKRRGCTCDTCL